MVSPRAHRHAAGIKLMAFDVDGILTDGSLYYSAQGDELKAFNTLDGHGLKMLASAGVILAIITGRRSRAVELRAENLGIAALLQGIEDKHAAMATLLDQHAMGFEAAGYMGDDVVDLPLLRACGFSAAVPGAHALVRQHVDYLTRADAGKGAVREVCDLILAAQGKLDAALAPCLAPVSTNRRPGIAA